MTISKRKAHLTETQDAAKRKRIEAEGQQEGRANVESQVEPMHFCKDSATQTTARWNVREMKKRLKRAKKKVSLWFLTQKEDRIISNSRFFTEVSALFFACFPCASHLNSSFTFRKWRLKGKTIN